MENGQTKFFKVKNWYSLTRTHLRTTSLIFDNPHLDWKMKLLLRSLPPTPKITKMDFLPSPQLDRPAYMAFVLVHIHFREIFENMIFYDITTIILFPAYL